MKTIIMAALSVVLLAGCVATTGMSSGSMNGMPCCAKHQGMCPMTQKAGGDHRMAGSTMPSCCADMKTMACCGKAKGMCPMKKDGQAMKMDCASGKCPMPCCQKMKDKMMTEGKKAAEASKESSATKEGHSMIAR